MRISKRFQGRPPYSPGGQPCSVILNANESFVKPSPQILAEFHQILDDCEFNRYPDPRAEELCRTYAAFYGLDWQCLTAGNGSDEHIELLYAALVAPGDRVVTVAPDFSMYGAGAYINDVEQFIYEQEDYVTDVDKLLAFAQEKDAAMIIFSNPCNPTGVAVPRQDVIRLIEGFEGLVVVDEAYMDFAEESVLDLAGKRDNLIVLKTCSKAIGLAGLRVGFTVTTPELTNLLLNAKAYYNVGRLTQSLVTAVLHHGAELRAAIAEIKESIAELSAELAPIVAESTVIEKMLPTSTNFVYLVTDRAAEIFSKMQEHDVLIRQPQADGLRINCGTKAENAQCVQALKAVLEELEA